MNYKLFVLYSLISLPMMAQDWSREPSQAPNEPPYVTEEEWEQSSADADSEFIEKSKRRKKKQNYEVVEETDKHYKVRHPWAAKGLKRITADGTYIFEKEESSIESFTGFRFGSQTFTGLYNSKIEKSFEDVYKTSTSLYLDFEKPLVRSWSNNLKLNYGVNLIVASGQGFSQNSKLQAQETYTLFMVPFHTGLTYHFQYLGETQWIVPYVSAGVDLFLIGELRNDGESIRTYTFGGHANAGLRFLIDNWVSDMDDLDEDYGINHMWLSLDFKKIIAGEKETIDITSDAITIGFGLDI